MYTIIDTKVKAIICIITPMKDIINMISFQFLFKKLISYGVSVILLINYSK